MSVSDYVSSNQLTSNCLATNIIHKTLPILSSNWDEAFMFTLNSASVPMLPCKCEANAPYAFCSLSALGIGGGIEQYSV